MNNNKNLNNFQKNSSLQNYLFILKTDITEDKKNNNTNYKKNNDFNTNNNN